MTIKQLLYLFCLHASGKNFMPKMAELNYFQEKAKEYGYEGGRNLYNEYQKVKQDNHAVNINDRILYISIHQ